jgi:L-seryl-tRNA(Ser) seleniumtransferase
VAEGADLVCFSGGKAIGGPQGTGILCGRRELVSAAALQHLDMDVLFELWEPPAALIDKRRLPGAPQHGLGRPCKVGKEQIAGLLTALRLFVAEGDEARTARWEGTVAALVAAMGTLRHSVVAAAMSPGKPVPVVRLALDEGAAGFTALDLARRLAGGTPAIHVNPAQAAQGILLFNPICLRDGDIETIAHRVREVLADG